MLGSGSPATAVSGRVMAVMAYSMLRRPDIRRGVLCLMLGFVSMTSPARLSACHLCSPSHSRDNTHNAPPRMRAMPSFTPNNGRFSKGLQSARSCTSDKKGACQFLLYAPLPLFQDKSGVWARPLPGF